MYRLVVLPLTFYMQVYHEPDHGLQTVSELRRHFPRSRIVVYCDGGADEGWRHRPHGVEYIHSSERSFRSGCLSSHLMFKRFLEQPTAHLIKLDADTQVHRPFSQSLPTGCVFGTLQFAGKPDESIQGGCMGFAADVAEKLYESELLLDGRLETAGYDTDDPHLVHLVHRRWELGLGSFDWSIAWACRKLGIPMRDFGDVLAFWQRRPDFQEGEFAITHPRSHKADISGDPDASEILARVMPVRSLAEER